VIVVVLVAWMNMSVMASTVLPVLETPLGISAVVVLNWRDCPMRSVALVVWIPGFAMALKLLPVMAQPTVMSVGVVRFSKRVQGAVVDHVNSISIPVVVLKR
jgi:hypothetical protein